MRIGVRGIGFALLTLTIDAGAFGTLSGDGFGLFPHPERMSRKQTATPRAQRIDHPSQAKIKSAVPGLCQCGEVGKRIERFLCAVKKIRNREGEASGLTMGE